MSSRIASLADGLISRLAPERTVSAASCWQNECWPDDICDGKRGRLMKVDPCDGRNPRFVRCGCSV